MSDKPKIMTMGYTGRQPNDILTTAESYHALIVDVRLKARSRVARWYGQAMKLAWGKRYVHIPEFGNVNYKTGGEFQIADFESGLKRLNECAVGYDAFILLCACKEYNACHRKVVAEKLSAEYGVGVSHLYPWGLAHFGVDALRGDNR